MKPTQNSEIDFMKSLINFDPSRIKTLIRYASSIGLTIRIITLTGGPCAGKTSSLIHLDVEFTKRGYQVILLPEAATIVRNQGFRAEQGVYNGDMCQWMMMVQNEYSLMMALINAIASHPIGQKRKLMIVRDRCSLDGAAYVQSINYFEAMTKEARFDIADMAYADVTAFLQSLAVDRPDLYEALSKNNPARFEDVAGAVVADRRLLSVYEQYGTHPHIITNDFDDFDQKLHHLVNVIVDALGEPRLEKEMAFMIYDPDRSFLKKMGFVHHVGIEQFYMLDGSRYRRVDYPGGMHSSFIMTEKQDTDLLGVRMETDSPVTAFEYVSAHESKDRDLNMRKIRKTRHFKTVNLDGKYFILEADEFIEPAFGEWIRVEVEYGLDMPNTDLLFEGYQVTDVTGLSEYSNKSVAAGKFPSGFLA